MSNLSSDVENLKKNYREIFLKTSEEINRRIEKMTQDELVKFLEEDILKELYDKQIKMLETRKDFHCSGCASCCKLACSEFSLSELQQKSQNGDNFATQFISVFVPYNTEDEAREIYPEYFQLLKEKAQDEPVYFYHCPKVTADNRCPDYENRPQICRDFPDNPIGFLPKMCGFSLWKAQTEPKALELHATFEIVNFYKNKFAQ